MTEKELEEANQLQKNLFSAKEKMHDINNFIERSKFSITFISIEFTNDANEQTHDFNMSEQELKDVLDQIHKMRKNSLENAAYNFDNFLK